MALKRYSVSMAVARKRCAKWATILTLSANTKNEGGKMNAIKITYAAPLQGAILIFILEDQISKKRDAKLLPDADSHIWSPKGDIIFTSSNIVTSFLCESNDGNTGSNENSADVTIEIEEMLARDTQGWCQEHGVIPEQLIIAFLRFCACAENYEAVRDWLGSGKAEKE
jgi:hypothetical protein